MTGSAAAFDGFWKRWHDQLEQMADFRFEAQPRADLIAAPAQTADAFAVELGLSSIGANWEMLDPGDDTEAPRSAVGAFGDALALDLTMKREWLGAREAVQCGRDFVSLFDPRSRMVLTNHIVRDGGVSEAWNPVTRSAYDWACVAYDDRMIALFLVTAET